MQARQQRVVATQAMMSMPATNPTSVEGFGDHCFKGAVAKKYLKYGSPTSSSTIPPGPSRG